MKIEKDTYVQFHYQIKDLQGKELESSATNGIAAYIHGHDNMLIGVERLLAGKQVGDTIEAELPPEEAYGVKDPDLLERVPIKNLIGSDEWLPGMVATIRTEHGLNQGAVEKVGKFMATVSFNHPYAGQRLNFTLRVECVREATEEELELGLFSDFADGDFFDGYDELDDFAEFAEKMGVENIVRVDTRRH